MEDAPAIEAASRRNSHAVTSRRLSGGLVSLSDAQIVEFYDEIDREGTGSVTFDQLIDKLDQVASELDATSNPSPLPEDLQSRYSEDLERGPGRAWLYAWLQTLIPDRNASISKDDFIALVRSWDIPSPSKPRPPTEQRPFGERLRTRWEIEGPRIAFITAIVALQVALGVWQMVKYINAPLPRSAFGWGVVLSKAAAGAIYPTFFFLLLSMSRYFATLIRRFRYVPRILNWDRSQSTHVWMAVAGLGLSTLHAIGYLAGSYIHGSQPEHQAKVQEIFDPAQAPTSYTQFLRKLPSWTGLTSLGLYWIISILSLPTIRKRAWGTFQLGHILMFPMLALLCAHGTLAILQYPMLGFWLAFPFFLVCLERSTRLAHGIRKVKARLEILDEYTVTITFNHPRGNWWNYEAGQYVFLQVPSISFWEWHPFTVSISNGKLVQVHIQTGGDWTRRLRTLDTKNDILIGVDGPFGAPAQRFYEFNRTIVLGAGVGITPFSAIITDLEQKLVQGLDPWAHVRRTDGLKTDEENSVEMFAVPPEPAEDGSKPRASTVKRRTDFHWIVREREDLLWFSTLLNRAYDISQTLPSSLLGLRINTYVTNKHKDLSTYVFRYLLDSRRTSPSAYSPLTGLKMRSQFGRPDLEETLRDYHNEMKELQWKGGRVGVFFCGSRSIGAILAQTCTKLNAISRRDGTKIKYVFIMEVFG